jgi:hypothetical protein
MSGFDIGTPSASIQVGTLLLHKRGSKFSNERFHEERIAARRYIRLYPKRLKLGRDDGAHGRDDDAFEAFKEFRLSAGGAGDAAKPSNLGGAPPAKLIGAP